MTTLADLHAHRDDILRLAREHGARAVRLFGSVARGEDAPNSDIDLLVEWEDRASLSDWVGFQQDVEALLGRRVDIVSAKSLHWYIRERVLAEARPLP